MAAFCTADFNPRSPQGERHVGDVVPFYVDISIHAPRRGSDHSVCAAYGICHIFQSTLPAGGATISLPPSDVLGSYFNPRSPQGERHIQTVRNDAKLSFQSTLPAGGATALSSRIHSSDRYFNPRSPQGERPVTPDMVGTLKNFNPRSPQGERRDCDNKLKAINRISIHAPRRGSDGDVTCGT